MTPEPELSSGLDLGDALRVIDAALVEDVGSGDVTSLAVIAEGVRFRGVMRARHSMVIAGLPVAREVFRRVVPEASFRSLVADGAAVGAGDVLAQIDGPAQGLLTAERTALNFLQALSGIATLTRQYVDKLQKYKTRILDTRKTTPNFRLLEKEAVRIGGGINNRFGLYDMILIKDNHIDYAGSVEKAIERANAYRRAYRPHLKIEVETRNIEEVQRVLDVGQVDRIMLDNFAPRQLSKALALIGEQFETEASGGINLNNVEDYARTGVDYVSIGGLIHQARSLDLSLKAIVK